MSNGCLHSTPFKLSLLLSLLHGRFLGRSLSMTSLSILDCKCPAGFFLRMHGRPQLAFAYKNTAANNSLHRFVHTCDCKPQCCHLLSGLNFDTAVSLQSSSSSPPRICSYTPSKKQSKNLTYSPCTIWSSLFKAHPRIARSYLLSTEKQPWFSSTSLSMPLAVSGRGLSVSPLENPSLPSSLYLSPSPRCLSWTRHTLSEWPSLGHASPWPPTLFDSPLRFLRRWGWPQVHNSSLITYQLFNLHR